MKPYLEKEVLTHPIVLSALAVSVIMATGSVVYFAAQSTPPQADLAQLSATSTMEVTGSGAVTPAQNPDLAFASGGRIGSVRIKVGDSVIQGETLASLDTSSLLAQLAQAQAQLSAAQAAVATQQAKLEGLEAGARPEDVAASQAALDKSKQDLANMYSGILDTVNDSYAKANDAVRTQLGPVFSNAETINPQLSYQTANSQQKNDAESGRIQASSILNQWQLDISSADQSTDTLDLLLKKSSSNLSAVRQFLNSVSSSLDGARGLVSDSTLASYKAAITVAQTEVNLAAKNINTTAQGIASQKLTIAQAQAQLDLKRAGATPQDTDAQRAQVQSAQAQVQSAQASIEGINAQIRNAVVIAPFSGSVTRVAVKAGQIIPANTVAVSLMPKSALQIESYFSESDAGRISSGADAKVTLDAYGSNRSFSAVVVSVDHSPTMQNGVPAYKVTLQFNDDDPAIQTGMTANVTIPVTH